MGTKEQRRVRRRRGQSTKAESKAFEFGMRVHQKEVMPRVKRRAAGVGFGFGLGLGFGLAYILRMVGW